MLMEFQAKLQLVDGADQAMRNMHGKRAPLWLTGQESHTLTQRRDRSLRKWDGRPGCIRTYSFVVCKSIQPRTFLTKHLSLFEKCCRPNKGHMKGSHLSYKTPEPVQVHGFAYVVLLNINKSDSSSICCGQEKSGLTYGGSST